MRATIEIYVSRRPGELSVQSYTSDEYGGTDLEQLDRAIAEAEAFARQCYVIKQEIAANGLGKAKPRGPGDPNLGQTVARVFDQVFKGRLPHGRL